MNSSITFAAAAIVATACLTGAADAGSFTSFFGEDLGLGENQPLPAFPNAGAAQSDFLSNLIGVGVENLESFSDGTTAPLTVDFGIAGDATLLGSGEINEVMPGNTNGVGRYATSGSNYWEASNDFSIQFSQPVAAFGFHGIDIGDFSGQVTLELGLVGGGSETLIVPNSMNISGGSVLFFGVITTDPSLLFTSVTFGNTAAGVDFFGFDDFTIGSLEQVNPIPLPAAGWLGLAGLAGLGLRTRGRRRRD